MVEENKESITQEKSIAEDIQETDDKEIYDAEELEKGKREANEFRVDHNDVHNQTNIQSAGTVNYYINKMASVKPKPTKGESYNLQEKESFIQFVEKYKDTDYFIVAFILCVFEAVAIEDLYDLKKKLAECLLQGAYPSLKSEEGLEKKMMDPFTSMDSIISVIQGQYYKDKEKSYVALGKEYLKSLEILMEQFPDMRNILILFIDSILKENKYHLSFYECQIVELLKYLHEKKIIDIEKKILPLLYSDQINFILIGRLFYKLYINKDTYDIASRTIDSWVLTESEWLWKSAVLVYVYLKEENRTCNFEAKLKRIIMHRIKFGTNMDRFFLADILMCSEPFCMLVSHAIHKLYVKENGNPKIAYMYVRLIRYCYYRVDKDNIRLPLVACSTKEQIQVLEDIVGSIMVDYRLRKQIYSLLQVYIKELSRYDYTPKLIRQIAAFCHALSRGDSIYETDIKEVIKKCPSKIANEIISAI